MHQKVKRCGHGFANIPALQTPSTIPHRRSELANPNHHPSEPTLPTQMRRADKVSKFVSTDPTGCSCWATWGDRAIADINIKVNVNRATT